MDAGELKERTLEFGLRCLKLSARLSRDPVHRRLGDQLVRSATGIGVHSRAALRARSKAEFVARLAVVEEACDASLFWLEIVSRAKAVKPARLKGLMEEAEELLKITVGTIRTAQARKPSSK